MIRAPIAAVVCLLISACECGGGATIIDNDVTSDGGRSTTVDGGTSDSGIGSVYDAGSYCLKSSDCALGLYCKSNGEFGGQCTKDPSYDAGVITPPFDAGMPPVVVDAGTGPCVHTTCSATSCGTITDVCGGTITCGPCATCSVVAAQYHPYTTNTELTDPAQCSNCPGTFSGFSALGGTLPSNATTVSLEGDAPGANTCCWEVEGPSGGLSSGSVVPAGGHLSATLPVFCGHNTVRLICSNDAGRRVLVRSLEAPCQPRDLRVTLAWDTSGTDMELHLVKGSGRINTDVDCTWYTCVGKTVNWSTSAEGNPHKDVDNVRTLGPENIFLQSAEAATYKVLVEFWGGGSTSLNEVAVTVREQTIATVSHRLDVHDVWYVGDITFPAGTFTKVDTITPCTASWRATSFGCDLSLP